MRKLGAVCVLHRKIKAMAGEQPENHSLRRLSSTDPSAFLRPEGRKPYLLAFPLQMTFRVRVYLLDIGKSCLHLCLALLPFFIEVYILWWLTDPRIPGCLWYFEVVQASYAVFLKSIAIKNKRAFLERHPGRGILRLVIGSGR